MYLHLGSDTVIEEKNIVGIFDLETASIGKDTKEFLRKSQKGGRVVDVTPELPKSFCVCLGKEDFLVYISQISTNTLQKRSRGDPCGRL